MKDNDQGIWTSLTCIREAVLVARRHRDAWNLTHLLPLPGGGRLPASPAQVSQMRPAWVRTQSWLELDCVPRTRL